MPNPSCPSCGREFKGFNEYPYIRINATEVYSLFDIPADQEVGGPAERLYEFNNPPTDSRNREHVVPLQVLDYFKTHPNEATYIPDDGYVYRIQSYHEADRISAKWSSPAIRTSDMVTGDVINVSNAWVSIISRSVQARALVAQLGLRSNRALNEYLAGIADLQVGSLEKPISLTPTGWEEYNGSWTYRVPDVEGVRLSLTYAKEKPQEIEVYLWKSGGHIHIGMGEFISKIATIARITYTGLLLDGHIADYTPLSDVG